VNVRPLDANGQRSFAVVLRPGDEAVGCLLDFARENDVQGGHLSGLGAFRKVAVGYFDLARKDYVRIPIDEQVEVVSLVGNFAALDGETKLHAHVVVAKRNGQAFGGHLLEAHVRPILEVVVEDEPTHLRRQIDPDTGLPLLRP
jgi:predicted DNA-binding protein with PD1-like motif